MNVNALNKSAILTMLLIAVMTVAAELSKNFKDFLKNLLGHHWTSKGIIALAFFILAYLILRRTNNEISNKNLISTVILTIVFALIIFLFYVFEYFKGG